MKVSITHDHPPIPVRSMDYSAVIDGCEGDGPYGHGSTAKAAAFDLLHELVASECSLEQFAAGLEAVMGAELAEAKDDGRNASYLAGYMAAMSTAMGFV